MSPPPIIKKNVTAIKVLPATGVDDLSLTIENTPEDRLDMLQQMTKLKHSLEKAKSVKDPNQ